MRAKLMDDGDGQIVIFPERFELSASAVSIKRKGDALVLKPRPSLLQQLRRLLNPSPK